MTVLSKTHTTYRLGMSNINRITGRPNTEILRDPKTLARRYEVVAGKKRRISEQLYREDGLIKSLLHSKELREQGQVHAWTFNY